MSQINLNLQGLKQDCFSRVCSLGLLPRLIRAEILHSVSQEIELGDDELFDARVQWAQKNNIFNEEQFQSFQAKFGMTDVEVGELAAQSSRVDKFVGQNFAGNLERKFLEIKDDYEEYTFSIIKVRDQGLAQEIYIQISEGESSFASLAAEYSLGIEKNTGGSVGPLLAKEISLDVLDLLRSRCAGELSPPVEINGIWVVIRIENRKSASLDEKMTKIISRMLFEEWLERAIQECVAELKSASSPVSTH